MAKFATKFKSNVTNFDRFAQTSRHICEQSILTLMFVSSVRVCLYNSKNIIGCTISCKFLTSYFVGVDYGTVVFIMVFDLVVSMCMCIFRLKFLLLAWTS